MPKINSDLQPGSRHKTNDGIVEVLEYRGCYDVLVRFIATGFESSFRAESIRLGTIKDRLKPSVFGVGFIGVGRHKSCQSRGVRTAHYERWYHMLERCYSPNQKERHGTYVGCSVCEEWHNFQSFADWVEANSNGIDDCQIDKDGLIPGNKVYSPNSCRLVSRQGNMEASCSKWFKLVSPKGEMFSVFNLSKFCRENGLSVKNMHMVCIGKRRSHFGWTAEI